MGKKVWGGGGRGVTGGLTAKLVGQEVRDKVYNRDPERLKGQFHGIGNPTEIVTVGRGRNSTFM